MALITDKQRAQAKLAGHIILTRGYSAFLRWMAENKAGHEVRCFRAGDRQLPVEGNPLYVEYNGGAILVEE